ncbi:MAG: hypothetical protein ACYSWO_24560 [Planctomycetota bacterium]|jgi:hypothetical protein
MKKLIITAMVATTILAVSVQGQTWSCVNLIVNGDFESGNTGFDSDYVYVAATGNSGTGAGSALWDEGKYAVGVDPYLYHIYWGPGYYDHTTGTGTGNMLIVNAAVVAGENVWEQTLPVIPGRQYNIAYWLANSYPVSPAELECYINGDLIATASGAAVGVGTWKEFSGSWDSGISNTATVRLVNTNIVAGGNDFTIDDISFCITPEVFELCAGQDTPIGTVEVWNDSAYIYVKFVTTEVLLQTHVHIGRFIDLTDTDFPLTKKGNPIPGHFASAKHYPEEHIHQFPIGSLCGTIQIAAHAAMGEEECVTIVSGDGQTIVTQRRSGNVSGFTPVNGPAVDAWEPGPNYPFDGPDDSSWEASSLWDQRLSINLVPTGADWIWESYRVLDPIYGTVLSFERAFDIGYPISGSLKIACDNGYEVFLNGGTVLGSDNVYGAWRTSDLKQGFVDVSGWDTVGEYDLISNLLEGSNTLTIDAANEYFNTDDAGNNAPGTESSNPGGLIFAMDLCYYADGETAWGEGCDGEPFPGKNWATYFDYTINGCQP